MTENGIASIQRRAATSLIDLQCSCIVYGRASSEFSVV